MNKYVIPLLSLCAIGTIGCTTKSTVRSVTPVSIAPAQAFAPASVAHKAVHLFAQGSGAEYIDGVPTSRRVPFGIILYFPNSNTEFLPMYGSTGKVTYNKVAQTSAVIHRQEVDDFLDVTLSFDSPTTGTASYKGGGGSWDYSACNVPFSIEPISGAVPEEKLTRSQPDPRMTPN